MLTGFQLKAAKAILGLTSQNIAEKTGVHSGTVTRWCKTKNLDYLPSSVKHLVLVKEFFEINSIVFPSKNSISFKRINKNPNPKSLDSFDTITRFQLKTARIATGLAQEELSFYIKISSSALSLLENLNNEEYIDPSKLNIHNLKNFYLLIGITFPDDLTVTLLKDPEKLVKQNLNSI
jgi:transcriptional regulator with XRE-family HTH domain